MSRINRRNFLRSAGTATAATLVAPRLFSLAPFEEPSRRIAANDNIQIALIGAGWQGMGDTHTAVSVPGVKLVAVADCYNGRLERSKELWGKQVFTTRDYNEILARKDIDAVIIGTPDHWHCQASVDALNAGKNVYCEKPMIHTYADGPRMIEAAQRSGKILQVGSQRVSSLIYLKAKELLASGAIGQLNMVQARWDRNSSLGAWNYTVPPDASPETCDWPRFLGNAPKIAWNPEHFFQWRKWKAYGTGVAGDLFVHLFSGTHLITGSHGPVRGMATGGLRFWKDGRDVDDVMLGLFDYKEGFNLALRVNFVDGGEESEGLTFTGSEGTMDIGWGSVTVNRVPHSTEPGYMVDSFPEELQKKAIADYHKKYPAAPRGKSVLPGQERYVAPVGYSDSYDHFSNFFTAIRESKPVVEDAVFGYRAAGAALLAAESIDRDQIVHWDPEAMKLL